MILRQNVTQITLRKENTVMYCNVWQYIWHLGDQHHRSWLRRGKARGLGSFAHTHLHFLTRFSLSAPTNFRKHSLFYPMQSSGQRTQYPYSELDQQTSPQYRTGSGGADTTMSSQPSGRSSSASSRSQSTKPTVCIPPNPLFAALVPNSVVPPLSLISRSLKSKRA